jgi:hypothetical protein
MSGPSIYRGLCFILNGNMACRARYTGRVTSSGQLETDGDVRRPCDNSLRLTPGITCVASNKETSRTSCHRLYQKSPIEE